MQVKTYCMYQVLSTIIRVVPVDYTRRATSPVTSGGRIFGRPPVVEIEYWLFGNSGIILALSTEPVGP